MVFFAIQLLVNMTSSELRPSSQTLEMLVPFGPMIALVVYADIPQSSNYILTVFYYF